MIQFHCADCGMPCRAQPEHAGLKTKCPRCGVICTIPSSSPAVAVAVTPPEQRTLAAETVAELPYASETPLPRGAAVPTGVPPGPSTLWVWIGLGTFAAIAVGLVLFFVLRQGNPKEEEKERHVNVAPDFKLVPRDAQAVATVRVADLAATPTGKTIIKAIETEEPDALKKLKETIGLGLEDIERVTIAVKNLEREPPTMWFIISTRVPLDEDLLIESFGGAERKHRGKTYWYKAGDADGPALHLHNDKTFVLAPEESMKECLAQRPQEAGRLDQVLTTATDKKHHVFFGMALTAQMRETFRQQLGERQDFMALVGKSVSFGVDARDPLRLDIEVEYNNAENAQKAKEEWEKSLIGFKQMFALLTKDAPPDSRVYLDIAEQALKQMRPRVENGNVVLGTQADIRPLRADANRWIREAAKNNLMKDAKKVFGK